jgi:hypothetical protein
MRLRPSEVLTITLRQNAFVMTGDLRECGFTDNEGPMSNLASMLQPGVMEARGITYRSSQGHLHVTGPLSSLRWLRECLDSIHFALRENA